MRANSGSGGVGCFVKKSLLKSYNVHILDDSYEGIFIVQLSGLPRVREKSGKFQTSQKSGNFV